MAAREVAEIWESRDACGAASARRGGVLAQVILVLRIVLVRLAWAPLVVCPRNGFTSPACSRRDRRTPDFRDDSRPPCWGTVTFEL